MPSGDQARIPLMSFGVNQLPKLKNHAFIKAAHSARSTDFMEGVRLDFPTKLGCQWELNPQLQNHELILHELHSHYPHYSHIPHACTEFHLAHFEEMYVVMVNSRKKMDTMQPM